MPDFNQIVLRRIADAAERMKPIAHDPRNWFSPEDYVRCDSRLGVIPGKLPNRRGGVATPDQTDVPLWPLLTHREPETGPLSMLFHYTVDTPAREDAEPVRRLTIRQHIPNVVQNDVLQAMKAEMWVHYGFNVLAYQWFSQSAELGIAIHAAPLVPVKQAGQIVGYTPITWSILLNHRSMTVPAMARRPVPGRNVPSIAPEDLEAEVTRAMDGDA